MSVVTGLALKSQTIKPTYQTNESITRKKSNYTYNIKHIFLIDVGRFRNCVCVCGGGGGGGGASVGGDFLLVVN